MATFAKSTFNAARYAVSRPTYPRLLFDSVLTYHEQSLALPGTNAGWEHAVDLGCGTGQATVELLRSDDSEPNETETEDFVPQEPPKGFDRVTGVDPSAQMIQGAMTHAATLGPRGTALQFIQSPAEKLAFLEDKSVDMVIAAQAAHWFDWEKLWPELNRVLRHGGTAAFWVYSEFRLPKYPELTPLITEYAQGTDPKTSLGPHWEPGRRILANHLQDIPDPRGWDDVTRVYFTGEHYPDLPQPHLETIMSKTMTWGGAGLHGYLRTFSALNRFHEAFPEDLEHPEGDIATRFLRQLMANAKIPLTPEGEAQEVEVEWPVALVVARTQLDPDDPWRERQANLLARVDAVKKEYDEKAAALPPAATVEETTARLGSWVEVQGQVLEMIEEDLLELQAEEEAEAKAKVKASPAVGEDGEEIEQEEDEEDYDPGRDRYLDFIDDTRTTLAWHITFKGAFDTALQLALTAEQELGTEDVAAGTERWKQLMREKIKEVGGPLRELSDNHPEELTDERVAQFSEDEIESAEEADALEGILGVAEELSEAVPAESVSELVRGLYISASEEVTRELSYE
ncbi:S-adenosyl-L-methionine-dependent methyltransferase [Mycena filopes]|nr:S-adenosyl-L-methionine-dependent methyltransferase [Mycena filopes]